MAAEVVAAPQGDFALVSRLQSYGVVTSAVGWYQNIKNSSNLLSTPLNFAESVAKRGIDVSIPVVKKIDSYTNIDQRSVAILDVIETRAAQAKDGISKVNTVAHQPLDTIIVALDSYLPNGAQGEKHKSEEVAAVYEESGKTRTAITVSKLGLISTHLKQAGETKLRELQLQGPVHKAIAHQAYELVSYSAAVLHLDTLGDSVAQRVADSQHQLFQAAANVKVKAQSVIESHPTLLSIEKAVEPYAAMTQNLATAVAMRVLTVVAAGSDLATNFFENRYADLQTILNRSAKYSAETIESWRKEHPDFDARITALVDTLRASFSSTVDTIRRLSSLSREQLATAYSSIFQVISTVEQTFAAFRKQLLSSAKFQLSLPSHQNARDFEGSPSAPEEEGDPSQAVEEEEEHHDTSSHKSRRQKKHHKH